MKKPKQVGLWILTVLLGLIALGIFPSFSCLFIVLLATLIIPIESWQSFLSKYAKKNVKTLAIVILTILMFITFPTENAAANEDSAIDTTTSTAYTTEPIESTFATTVSTTPPTTTPTFPPTTEVVVPPINEPTTPPATESVTAPTTEPTTPYASESTTPPTTAPVHVHNFNAATCTSPKICSCGVTEGDANGHSWKDATCSEPMICSICNSTSGSALGHNYSGGVCTVCQKDDPNYVYETMVWIPTKGGSKYHTSAGCSNMDGPEQVTQSEAEALGFTPCKRCH